MLPKSFLYSSLVTLLATGLLASPTIGARDIKSQHGSDRTVTPVDKVGVVGEIKPLHIRRILTPNDNDVPVAATSVDARDLESLGKRSLGCVLMTKGFDCSGESVYICSATPGSCISLNNDWRFSVKSFSPDPGTYCQLFTLPNCAGTSSPIYGASGCSSLGTFSQNLGSFRCWW
ncbi:hypothetical protein HOY80DRAFT_963312 [Tuber brumale]|nr:hypothetical protein HOY80DRAFT_963312 [Tuber brumale]